MATTRSDVPTQPCPTPEALRFSTVVALRRTFPDHIGRPARCVCGWLHPGNRFPEPTEDELVQGRVHVAFLDETAFAELVDREARDCAPPAHAAALRSPEIRNRWRSALRLMIHDLQAQLAERGDSTSLKDERWRRKVSSLLHRCNRRSAEVRELNRRQGEYDRQEAAERKAEQERQRLAAHETRMVEAAGVRQALEPMKAARRAAGDRAKQRLIEQHWDEFQDLLDEEYAAVDLPRQRRDRPTTELPGNEEQR